MPEPKNKKFSLVYTAFFILLLFFVGLIIFRYSSGVRVLNQYDSYVNSLDNFFNDESSSLAEPVIKLSDPKFGDSNAEHVIVVYTDFTCSYCGDLLNVLNEYVSQHPGGLLVVWKDVINEAHTNSQSAAIAARCAQVQNKFWQYASYLFANQDSLGNDLYQNLAGTLDLDTDSFASCLASQNTLPLINADVVEAEALKIDATPYLFVDGQRFSGALTMEQLVKLFNP